MQAEFSQTDCKRLSFEDIPVFIWQHHFAKCLKGRGDPKYSFVVGESVC